MFPEHDASDRDAPPAVAIQHCMDGAFDGDLDLGKPQDQTLSDLPGAPAGVLTLNVQNILLHLEGELMGIPIGRSASVGQPLNAAFLVVIEDLVTGLAGDPKFPAEFRHRLAREPQTAAFRPLPNTPSTASLPPQKKGNV